MARWFPVVREVCQSTGADPYLAAAIIMAESSFIPSARGDSGDSIGFFQINVAGGAGTGIPVWLLDIPEVNLAYGCQLLAWYAEYFPDDLNSQIASHNQGVAGTRKYGWERVAGYVEKVLGYHEIFKEAL